MTVTKVLRYLSLEICLEGKRLEGISKLAIKHYGEDSEVWRRRVVETTLEMRMLWSRSVKQLVAGSFPGIIVKQRKLQEYTKLAIWEVKDGSCGGRELENGWTTTLWKPRKLSITRKGSV